MALTKLTTAGIANDAFTSDTIEDGSIQNVDLANSSITINGTAVSLGGSITAGTDWQAVTVADGSTQLNAVAGKGYFLDTNAGVIDVKLPTSPTRGDTIILADYGNTFATNRVVVDTGGKLIDSTVGSEPGSGGFTINTNGAVVELVFADDTAGWIVKQNNAPSDLVAEDYSVFISATGGTVTTSGDYKIHTFTGDGCFVVTAGSGTKAEVSYLVVAGGGGTVDDRSGGGGAGGFREGKSSLCTHTASPLATTGLPVTITTYPITVGAGGAAAPSSSSEGGSGGNSVFSTVTSTGGGGGARTASPGIPGGSGGGGNNNAGPAGTGNTPPVSPPQGSPGGIGTPNFPPVATGGGGGGTAAGSNAPNNTTGGAGGAGAGTNINPATGESGPGCLQYYAGGGGGGSDNTGRGCGGVGGGGDGATGPYPGSSVVATGGSANTGGGAGGSNGGGPSVCGKAGGKGIVIIKYKFQ